MQHKLIEVYYLNGTSQKLMVDYDTKLGRPRVLVEQGVARFGRTEGDQGWQEMVAAPLTSILKWS